jgi:hypothetical protein
VEAGLGAANYGYFILDTNNPLTKKPLYWDADASDWRSFVGDLQHNNVWLGDASNQPVDTPLTNIALSEWGAAITDIDMGGFKITNLATPTGGDPLDVSVNKGYVDALFSGISAWWSVTYASTADIGGTLSGNNLIGNTVFPALDGIAVAVGEKVLLKNQADAKTNGPYTLTARNDTTPSWTLTRLVNAEDGDTIVGAQAFVGSGNTQAGNSYRQTADPCQVPLNDQTWELSGISTTYRAGNGMVLSSGDNKFHFCKSTNYRLGNVFRASSTTQIEEISGIGKAGWFLRNDVTSKADWYDLYNETGTWTRSHNWTLRNTAGQGLAGVGMWIQATQPSTGTTLTSPTFGITGIINDGGNWKQAGFMATSTITSISNFEIGWNAYDSATSSTVVAWNNSGDLWSKRDLWAKNSLLFGSSNSTQRLELRLTQITAPTSPRMQFEVEDRAGGAADDNNLYLKNYTHATNSTYLYWRAQPIELGYGGTGSDLSGISNGSHIVKQSTGLAAQTTPLSLTWGGTGRDFSSTAFNYRVVYHSPTSLNAVALGTKARVFLWETNPGVTAPDWSPYSMPATLTGHDGEFLKIDAANNEIVPAAVSSGEVVQFAGTPTGVTSITATHSLSSTEIMVQVYRNNIQVFPEVTVTSASQITFGFAQNQYDSNVYSAHIIRT